MSSDSIIAWNIMKSIKKNKIYIMITFTCNIDDIDRFESMFIEYTKKSWLFNKKIDEEHEFFYYNNKKAWMIEILFQEYLKRFDQYIHYSIIFIIDNVFNYIWENLQLCNIKILSLSSNMTSKLQSLDAEIITIFKRHYRRKQIAWKLDQLELDDNSYKITQF